MGFFLELGAVLNLRGVYCTILKFTKIQKGVTTYGPTVDTGQLSQYQQFVST